MMRMNWSRKPGDDVSINVQTFPFLPIEYHRDAALGIMEAVNKHVLNPAKKSEQATKVSALKK